MKTLKEYVDLQKFTGMSDFQIIESYFIGNDIEEDGMELANNLAKSKIEKMRDRLHGIEEWACWLPSKYLYENYPLDIANKLHMIELDYIINGNVTEGKFEWAKDNFPNIKMPNVYFIPCMEWLEEKGIKFKEE